MQYHEHSTGRVCVWLPTASEAWRLRVSHPDRVHREPDKRRRNSFARTPVGSAGSSRTCAQQCREKDRRSVRASRWIDARAGETRHNSGLVHLVPRWVSLAALDIHRCVLQHVHAAACSQGDRPPTAVSPAVSTAPLLDGDTAQVDGVEHQL